MPLLVGAQPTGQPVVSASARRTAGVGISTACTGVGPSPPRVSKTIAESTAAVQRPPDLPDPGPQAFGDQQVALAVDARQQTAVVGDPGASSPFSPAAVM